MRGRTGIVFVARAAVATRRSGIACRGISVWQRAQMIGVGLLNTP
jgi:hypothetical protein